MKETHAGRLLGFPYIFFWYCSYIVFQVESDTGGKVPVKTNLKGNYFSKSLYVVNFGSKYSRLLTFENLYQVHLNPKP